MSNKSNGTTYFFQKVFIFYFFFLLTLRKHVSHFHLFLFYLFPFFSKFFLYKDIQRFFVHRVKAQRLQYHESFDSINLKICIIQLLWIEYFSSFLSWKEEIANIIKFLSCLLLLYFFIFSIWKNMGHIRVTRPSKNLDKRHRFCNLFRMTHFYRNYFKHIYMNHTNKHNHNRNQNTISVVESTWVKVLTLVKTNQTQRSKP